MQKRITAAEIWATTFLLLAYGVWGAAVFVESPAFASAVTPSLTIIAAIGVALRKQWSRPLVLFLVALFVGTWLYWILVAFFAGFYRSRSAGHVLVSLMPGILFSTAALFCGYVAMVRMRAPCGKDLTKG